MHEVVTLQFGSYANYVGTHFWNTQESYFTYNPAEPPSIVDHDINFRPGIGADGSDTYTPRALIYDLKSQFGSLRKVNALYELDDQETSDNVWHGERKVQTAPVIEPSPYQIALETGLPTSQIQSKDVRYWSDYNRVYFHPRSLVQLSSQSLTSQLSAFESYAAGSDLFKTYDQEIGGILDRDVRLFAEECDSLQGFQIFASTNDAWGGFMGRYLEELQDDFGKKSVWVWSLEDGRRLERSKQLIHATNSAHSLINVADYATAYIRTTAVPSHLPSYIDLEPASNWSTSALLASIIETSTLPSRLRIGSKGSTKMSIIEAILSGNNERKIWNVQGRADPANVHEDSQNGHTANGSSTNGTMLGDARLANSQRRHNVAAMSHGEDDMKLSFDIDFTPTTPSAQATFPSLRQSTNQQRDRNHDFTQTIYLRSGNPQKHSHLPVVTQYEQLRRMHNEETVIELYQIPLSFPVLNSSPHHLFNFGPPEHHSDNTQHNAQPSAVRSMGTETKHIDIETALSTQSRTKLDLLALRDLTVGRIGRSLSLVDANDRETVYDVLTRMAQNYSYGYEDDFSDDDDGQDD